MISGGNRSRGINKHSSIENPVVTIITVVYNRVKYLEQSILSVLNQTYKNIEYIIIDGGSTDGTLKVIKEYDNMIDYWLSEPDKGMYYALNKGIALASGELIGICHSDDYYHSNDLIYQLVEFHKVVKSDVYHGDAIYLLETKEKTKLISIKSDHEKILQTHRSIIHPTTFIAKDIFRKYGFYDTKYKSASDYEMMIRLMKYGCIFQHFGLIISCIRLSNQDRVSNNCYGHIEAYSIHKYHKTGNHNKYLFSYLECKSKRILKKIISSLKLVHTN